MTYVIQRKSWCTWLLVAAVSVSAKAPFYDGRYPSLFWRGGAQPSTGNRPPPPPPPRQRPSSQGQQYTVNERMNQQDGTRIIPPPPRQEFNRQQTMTPPPQHQYSSSVEPQRNSQPTSVHHDTESNRPIPPPPRLAQQKSATVETEPRRQQQPPPPPISRQRMPQQNQRAETTQSTLSADSRLESETFTDQGNGSIGSDERKVASSLSPMPKDVTRTPKTVESFSTSSASTNDNSNAPDDLLTNHPMEHHDPSAASQSQSAHVAPKDDVASAQSTSSPTSPSSPRAANSDNMADFLFLVPPKEELDRISLQTALSGRPRRVDSVFGNLIQLRQHLALEQLLVSQQSVKEQVLVITRLLQELVTQQRQSNSLVVHVPKHVAFIPPRRVRRRVEKVRIIPRTTILSSLQDVENRDLSDGEFDALVQDLQTPSEVEEVYHEYEYEYDDEEWLRSDYPASHVTSTTPNADDVNAFLRESSESDSWYSAEEVHPYDSDVYYDDYYDMEPFEEELLAAWSVSDDSVTSPSDEKESEASRIEASVMDTETATSSDASTGAGLENGKVDILVDAGTVTQLHDERREDVVFEEAHTRSTPTRIRQQHQKPPPPPPPPRQHFVNQRRSHSSTRRATEAPRPSKFRPPPPPVRNAPETSLSSKHDPALYKTSNEAPSDFDESEDLDEEELRLLEETAVDGEIVGITREDEVNVEDDEDSVDEDDLRILQFSRWMPFSRKKNTKDYQEDLLLDDDFFTDEVALDDVSTDDFTDFDVEESALSLSTTVLDVIEEESSSEEEMLLGESAVTERVTQYESAGSHLDQLPPPPPPPRPPPRPPLVGNVAPRDQLQTRSILQHVGGTQYTPGCNYEMQQPLSPRRPEEYPPAINCHQDQSTNNPGGYQNQH